MQKTVYWYVGELLLAFSCGLSIGVIIGGDQMFRYFIPPIMFLGLVSMLLYRFETVKNK